MRLHAYILAADPAWIRTSVERYYDHVDRIVVSHDEASLGWTGSPIRVGRCLEALRELDLDDKLVLLPGNYHSAAVPSHGDTQQRKAALAAAAVGADWVLQLDTDEVLPDPSALLDILAYADEQGLAAVEWPMRVLYRRTSRGRYLEVRGAKGEPHFEYPGPIAVRFPVELVDCRRAAGAFLRPTVRGDVTSTQIARPAGEGEHRAPLLDAEEAIWHNSWARSRSDVKKKIDSWGHNQGWRSRRYYWATWIPSPITWRALRDFHPFAGGLWPRLGIVRQLPFPIHPKDR